MQTLKEGMSEAKVINWLVGFLATSYWGIIFLFFKQRKKYLVLIWVAVVVYGDCRCWLFLASVLIHYSSGSKIIILPCNSSILFYFIYAFGISVVPLLSIWTRSEIKSTHQLRTAGDEWSAFNVTNCLCVLISWGGKWIRYPDRRSIFQCPTHAAKPFALTPLRTSSPTQH